jgi:hypothetical protein
VWKATERNEILHIARHSYYRAEEKSMGKVVILN